MFWVYVLKSLKSSKYYVGYTDDLERRLSEHNAGKVISTRSNRPWEVFHIEKFEDEVLAMRRERQIKGWKSRKAIERLKFL